MGSNSEYKFDGYPFHVYQNELFTIEFIDETTSLYRKYEIYDDKKIEKVWEELIGSDFPFVYFLNSELWLKSNYFEGYGDVIVLSNFRNQESYTFPLMVKPENNSFHELDILYTDTFTSFILIGKDIFEYNANKKNLNLISELNPQYFGKIKKMFKTTNGYVIYSKLDDNRNIFFVDNQFQILSKEKKSIPLYHKGLGFLGEVNNHIVLITGENGNKDILLETYSQNGELLSQNNITEFAKSYTDMRVLPIDYMFKDSTLFVLFGSWSYIEDLGQEIIKTPLLFTINLNNNTVEKIDHLIDFENVKQLTF